MGPRPSRTTISTRAPPSRVCSVWAVRAVDCCDPAQLNSRPRRSLARCAQDPPARRSGGARGIKSEGQRRM
eukprot:12384092-Alexandrium_andersonii.AAC.1